MRLDMKCVFATSALALGVAQASAATSVGEYVTFSGFGTTGVVISDYDDADYVRYGQPSGADESIDYNVDSNLGLQVTAKPTHWLSGTVQLLTQQRYEENMSSEVEWAFVGVQPVEGLSLRVGRTAMPTFAISDTRNVGFANNWVRPPNEVYGLATMKRLEGADLTYGMSLGSTALKLTALAGESSVNVAGTDMDVKGVKGATVEWDTPWASFRVGQIRGDLQLSDLGFDGEEEYTFSGAGVSVDRDNLVARAEYVTRRSKNIPTVDADGWYVFGGYRFASVLPYMSYATTEPQEDYLPTMLAGEQATISAGVRWDAFSSASIKFQIDHVDTNDTHGISFVTPVTSVSLLGAAVAPVTENVNVFSLAVDFVF